MDEALIANWNSVVSDRDDVYVIGDMFFRTETPAEKTLKRLKGKKHLILGNHDKSWVKDVNLTKYFREVTNLLTYKESGVKYTLCHYPMVSWEGKGHRGYMIHGHTHNHPVDYTDPYLLNAGVEINNYRPVVLEKLIANNERFRVEQRWFGEKV
jgi:calcineurin-like phosphoesterase family protein